MRGLRHSPRTGSNSQQSAVHHFQDFARQFWAAILTQPPLGLVHVEPGWITVSLKGTLEPLHFAQMCLHCYYPTVRLETLTL